MPRKCPIIRISDISGLDTLVANTISSIPLNFIITIIRLYHFVINIVINYRHRINNHYDHRLLSSICNVVFTVICHYCLYRHRHQSLSIIIHNHRLSLPHHYSTFAVIVLVVIIINHCHLSYINIYCHHQTNGQVAR